MPAAYAPVTPSAGMVHLGRSANAADAVSRLYSWRPDRAIYKELQRRMNHKTVLSIACMMLLCGCAVYTHQGVYDASDSKGWRREASEGTTFFYPFGARNAEGFISFTTEKHGELMMVAYFPGKTVCFDEEQLRVIPSDGSPAYQVSLSISHIQVPTSSDFSIEVPAMTADKKLLPPLKVHFSWSDRRYRAYRILQSH
jgi:hypothetical protein